MAKANKPSGATFTPEELSDEDGPRVIRIRRAELGVVDQCRTETDGLDSSASSMPTQKNVDNGKQQDLKPVNAENPSSKTEPDSAALSTDDGGLTTDQESPEGIEHLVEDDEIPPYSEWTVTELQDECVSRDLPKSGNKKELVARLEAHDEETADQ